MKTVKSILVIIVFMIFSSGCTHNSYSEENIAPLGPALTKLSFAMEACVKKDNSPPEGIDDDILLKQCTEYDPTLLKPFEEYRVKVLKQNKRVVLLVCDKDGKRALLEDASCTARLDKRRWQGKNPQPCEFTLSPDKVCKRP